jgi:hypothetical protein
MKKFLPCLALIIFLFQTSPVKAQCELDFANLETTVTDTPIPLGPDKCLYRVNASFDVIANGGFKVLFFHSWLLQDYPSPPIFDCSNPNTPATDPGTSAQLGTLADQPGKSFVDIGFQNLDDVNFLPNVPVNITSNFALIYPHDPTVVLTTPATSPGLTAIVTRRGTSDTLHFEITNLNVTVNTPCGTPLISKTDIWGSNSNAPDPKAQCYVCGYSFSFGNPHIALQKVCTVSPFQYQVTLTSSGPLPLHVVYRLYADDLDGIREPAGDDSLLFTSDTIVLNPGSPYTSGLVNLPGDFCCSEPWSQWGIYVQVTAREFDNTLSTPVIEEACAAQGPLPVSLISFTATRNNSNVLLRWETAMEENNRGFFIERNFGDGVWQTTGFVPTNAMNGNSSTSLTYEYTDLNNSRGITQYRLRQVDIDGRHAYSPIRIVRATGQKGKTIVYPNPSTNGSVNVVFSDRNNAQDVWLSDVNGRLIRRWKAAINNIQIENLPAGFYTIRILDTETGEQTVEKIVVKQR